MTSWLSASYMTGRAAGVSSTGTFICPEALTIEYATNKISPEWAVVRKYLCN